MTKFFSSLSKRSHSGSKRRCKLGTSLSTKIERDPVRGILKMSHEEDVNSLLRDHGLEEIGEEGDTNIRKRSASL